MLKTFTALFLFSLIAWGCHENSGSPEVHLKTTPPVDKRVDIQYRLLFPKDSIKKLAASADTNALAVIAAVNRTDIATLANFDSIVVPADLHEKAIQYFPFPFKADILDSVNKIIFFSYPAQAFAAYDHGRLIYTGATNMGRKNDLTPTGLFYTNWKAETTTSTFNDEWDLKWNFNVENKLGVGFHEYKLPGYPASHSCMRLKETDALDLYNWADQWKISGTDSIVAHGTPVVVFGSYPFGSPRPWLALASNPQALMISESDIENIVKPLLADIMQKQKERQ